MADFALERFLPYRLAVVASAVSKGFARRYGKRFGLSIAEWRVIAHLSQADAVSVREIHARVDLDKPKVSRAATRLEAAGLVTKRTSNTDKRLIELSLTAKGRDVLAQLIPMARAYEEEIIASLPPEDQVVLDRALRRLQNTL